MHSTSLSDQIESSARLICVRGLTRQEHALHPVRRWEDYITPSKTRRSILAGLIGQGAGRMVHERSAAESSRDGFSL